MSSCWANIPAGGPRRGLLRKSAPRGEGPDLVLGRNPPRGVATKAVLLCGPASIRQMEPGPAGRRPPSGRRAGPSTKVAPRKSAPRNPPPACRAQVAQYRPDVAGGLGPAHGWAAAFWHVEKGRGAGGDQLQPIHSRRPARLDAIEDEAGDFGIGWSPIAAPANRSRTRRLPSTALRCTISALGKGPCAKPGNNHEATDRTAKTDRPSDPDPAPGRHPLNLRAVRRRQPKLLQQVMTLKHFRGWRKAVEAAGLSYRKIRTELLDYCACALCGEELLVLNSHLWAKHGVTEEEVLPEVSQSIHHVGADAGRKNRLPSSLTPPLGTSLVAGVPGGLPDLQA